MNEAGKVLKSYGREPGSGDGQLDTPVKLAVMNGFIFVADRDNKRVLMLSSELSFIREILSHLSYEPFRMYFDEHTGRTVVSEFNGNKTLEIYAL